MVRKSVANETALEINRSRSVEINFNQNNTIGDLVEGLAQLEDVPRDTKIKSEYFDGNIRLTFSWSWPE